METRQFHCPHSLVLARLGGGSWGGEIFTEFLRPSDSIFLQNFLQNFTCEPMKKGQSDGVAGAAVSARFFEDKSDFPALFVMINKILEP